MSSNVLGVVMAVAVVAVGVVIGAGCGSVNPCGYGYYECADGTCAPSGYVCCGGGTSCPGGTSCGPYGTCLGGGGSGLTGCAANGEETCYNDNGTVAGCAPILAQCCSGANQGKYCLNSVCCSTGCCY